MAIELTTAAAVEKYLGLGPERDRAELEAVVAAVNGVVAEWKGLTEGDEVADQVSFGALMLSARVYRRRNSPAGVEALGELGPVYVSRNDPDLAMMLGLGSYRPPMIG